MSKHAFIGFVVASVAIVTVALSDGVPRVSAQQPPAASQKPRPAAAAWPKRLPDGQPDVRGYWNAVGREGGSGTLLEQLDPQARMRGLVIDPPDGRIPYLPWARARRDEVRDNQMSLNAAQVDTATRAWPDGLPRLNYYGIHPFQILQVPGAVVILYEKQHEFRYIPLDSRPQPGAGVKMWLGSSRGRWEGTTFVAQVSNITDRVRLSNVGDFASDGVAVTERWEFLDAETIRLSTTFEDPKVYTRPWTVVKMVKRVADPELELMEYAGVEGERNSHLIVDIPQKAREQQQQKERKE